VGTGGGKWSSAAPGLGPRRKGRRGRGVVRAGVGSATGDAAVAHAWVGVSDPTGTGGRAGVLATGGGPVARRPRGHRIGPFSSLVFFFHPSDRRARGRGGVPSPAPALAPAASPCRVRSRRAAAAVVAGRARLPRRGAPAPPAGAPTRRGRPHGRATAAFAAGPRHPARRPTDTPRGTTRARRDAHRHRYMYRRRAPPPPPPTPPPHLRSQPASTVPPRVGREAAATARRGARAAAARAGVSAGAVASGGLSAATRRRAAAPTSPAARAATSVNDAVVAAATAGGGGAQTPPHSVRGTSRRLNSGPHSPHAAGAAGARRCARRACRRGHACGPIRQRRAARAGAGDWATEPPPSPPSPRAKRPPSCGRGRVPTPRPAPLAGTAGRHRRRPLLDPTPCIPSHVRTRLSPPQYRFLIESLRGIRTVSSDHQGLSLAKLLCETDTERAPPAVPIGALIGQSALIQVKCFPGS